MYILLFKLHYTSKHIFVYVHRKIKNTLSWWYQKKTTASSSLKIFFSFLSFTYFITVVVFRTKRQIESHMPFHYSCPLLSQCYLYDLTCIMKVSMKCYMANIDATRNEKTRKSFKDMRISLIFSLHIMFLCTPIFAYCLSQKEKYIFAQ